MSAKAKTADKSAAEPGKPRPRKSRPLRWLLMGGLVVGLTGGAAYAVWKQVREHVLASSEYQIDPQNIVMTPQPRWIRADVRAEVIRDASFDGPLSLLDGELTVRMANAFAAHPWVGHVERVSKHYPSGLEVVLAYRQPVAMVEVPDGALPVDADGVVLPTADFQPGEADLYPRIGEINTTPSGGVGTRWGDASVIGAAQVAAALAGEWKALGLFRITPAGRRPAGRGAVEYAFTLHTRSGTRIDWGLSPSTALASEPMAADKIARLKKYVAEHGSLDGADGPQQLRFVPGGDLEAAPRPQIKAIPKKGQ